MKIKILFVQITILLCLLANNLHAQTNTTGYKWLRQIESNRTTGKTQFYKFISASDRVVAFALPVTFFAVGVIEKNTEVKKKSLYILESTVITLGATFLLKEIIKKDRPGVRDSTFHPVVNESGYAFPSGHTSTAFAMATSFTLAHPRWYVALPAFTYATLVGYSRLYLGVHYPVDILAGAILGSGTAWLTFKANQWINKSKKDKQKKVALL